MIRKSFLFLFCLCAVLQLKAQIERVEPAFWYTGMKNHELQVMLYGNDIANYDVSLAYPGVSIKQVCKVENPNYLFVYLDVTSGANPGKFNFTLTKGKKKIQQPYELRSRNSKVGAQGFSKADVLYLIMPDRFANGDPKNDNYEEYKVDRSRGGSRHGGDFKGIADHLDYLNDLGITAIWLNPIQYNKGNGAHGYAISDFYMTDPRLGTNDEYCQLIDQAHGKGIKVVMDMIFNHSGSSHWWMQDLPSKDWYNQGQIAETMGKMMKEGGDMRRMMGNQNDGYFNTTHYKWVLMDPHAPKTEKDILLDGWFTRGMPDLNQRNPHLATYLIQNSIWWIEYARIDGIRMDTYPYADADFMARWCKELYDEYPDFNIVGEGWYPRNSAAGWWQRGSRMHDWNTQLKTVMDFDLTFTAKRELKKESNTKEGQEAGLFKLYECLTQDFLIPDPDNVLVFLDNHDLSRFMEEGDPLWKFKQGIAFLLTTRGIPQLYYGTEILMTGETSSPGGDANVRKDFPGGWEGDSVNAFTPQGRTADQNEAWNFMSTLLKWRRNHPVMANGHLVHYTPDNDTRCYVYAKTDGKNTVLVMLNGSDSEKQVDMKRFSEVIGTHTMGQDAITGKQINLTEKVAIPSRGVWVLDLK